MVLLDKLFRKDHDAETNFQLAFEKETTDSNHRKALRFYERAANQGLAKAQYYCGFMYLKGRGTRRNIKKAFRLILKSAQQGHPHGQYLLAHMYLSGEGIERNEELGNEWLKKFRSHNLSNGVILCFHSL